jgi:TrbL/VirB6 plasmid conjugal transfer protein
MRARLALRRWRRPALTALALSAVVLLAGHPLASAATDVWGNVGPAPQLGSSGLFGRYPLSHYMLDQHFDAVSASLTGGVDVSGVPPMIAYFLASILWLATSFLANLLITLFSFAFSLDLVNGSQATGGAGALGPVSQAIHSIYANVFGAPWLVLAITVAGLWAIWKSLLQRRHSETVGALALSLVYVVLALFFVVQPGATIGGASAWTNQMSEAFLSISDHGTATGGAQAKNDAANQLFELLVFKPWVVLNFGGLEHCAVAGTGSSDSDPESAPVRPLSSSQSGDAALARRLASGTEVSADGKVCINNANKYAPHFLRFSLGADGQDDRGAEYDALNNGDSSKLPEADTARRGYRLGVADKPATDAMEAGGQYQRLLLALLLFFGELGAFCLLGALAVGVILAQVLLLLLLAFAPVALVAAAIPGRGHAFFKGWLEKLAGYLLRKAAYSLILAILLAVSGALASATAQLGWLMSFGLQSVFFWAVFLQRKTLADSLIGIATGPGTPGREGTVRVLALYAGARVGGKALRPIRRGASSALRAPGRLFGSRGGGGKPSSSTASPAPRSGTSSSTPVGGGAPSLDAPGPAERRRPADTAADSGKGKGDRRRPASASSDRMPAPGAVSAKGAGRRSPRSRQEPDRKPKGKADKDKPTPERSGERRPKQAPPRSAEPVRKVAFRDSAASLGEELRAERERVDRKPPSEPPEAQPPARRKSAPPPRRTPRKGGGR